MLRATLLRWLRPYFRSHPEIKRSLIRAEQNLEMVRNTAALAFPILIRAQPQRITIAITARCNYRCVGCRYGRDFMPGAELSLETVRDVIDDAAANGIAGVRFYGGEPLLHKDLPAMIEYAVNRRLSPFISTNGLLLGRHARALRDAGLRAITIGYYGSDEVYNRYVGVANAHARLNQSLRETREIFGENVHLSLSFLLMRPTCSVEALDAAWQFASRHEVNLHMDLLHYSLPYFSEGPNRELQFRTEDGPAVRRVVDRYLELKDQVPGRITEADCSVRSIPDWIAKGPGMEVPCDTYNLLWVGADGSVQLCYAAFPLGNVHERRLKDILFTPEHHAAARGAFQLQCPHCHCERTTRILKHLPSRIHYSLSN